MNRALSSEELKTLQADFPVVEEPKPLTRYEKLMRWAELVDKHVDNDLGLYHRLEYYSEERRALLVVVEHRSALGVAARDKMFQKDGLADKTALGVQRYFELDTQDLHEFSCDCGGYIDNHNQAQRIRNIAGRGASQQSLGSRLLGAVGF